MCLSLQEPPLFCFVDSALLPVRAMFKHRFPLQDDQVVMVTLFFIDTVHLAGFPKFLTRGSNGGSRCGPDDFSAI